VQYLSKACGTALDKAPDTPTVLKPFAEMYAVQLPPVDWI